MPTKNNPEQKTRTPEQALTPNHEPPLTPEETLDPADWGALRRLGHRMVDDMMDYLQTVRERPAWTRPPEEVISQLQQPVPRKPGKAEMVYEDFLTQVLPYNKNNIHPRFWSWVEGGGTPFGMLSDMLASGMNANLAIGNHSPVYVERQVLDWSKELFGFPPTAGAILTSGASMANITALTVARNQFFNAGIKQQGLHALPGQLTVYGSSETHNCLLKGVEVIGVGSDNFRKVPVDEQYRIRTDLLQQMISEDRKAGFFPFCIVGNAGTVNTGAIDDLEALATIAKREDCWFHIDGAFGAIPWLLPEFRETLKGLESADSLSFDFHKWLYMNYEVGCVLIRDSARHRAAFSSPVNYLAAHQRGLSAGPDPFANYGMELSRGFKALKVWMLLKEHGTDKFARLVRQNIDQAQYLGRLIVQNPELELLTAISLNIVCYRYNPGGLDEQELNALNKEILMQLHEKGIATPSYTLLEGRYAIRVAITNHRSRKEDFDLLVQATIRIGNETNYPPVPPPATSPPTPTATPSPTPCAIEIREYSPAHQPFFEQLYRSWFTAHFQMEPEPIDVYVLTQPQSAILEHDGAILIAFNKGEPAGSVALKKTDAYTHELTKMAVSKEYRGLGIGEALTRAAIQKGLSLGAQRIILYSHSSLEAALHIYRKLGFKEIPLEPGIYSPFRCDIKMELWNL